MSGVDTRNLSRDSFFLMAELRLEGEDQVHRVKVRNLSSGGMMADGPVPVMRGARLQTELRNIGIISGTVAWTQDNRFGIAFDREIDPRLARAPMQGGDTEAPRFTRPSVLRSLDPTDPSRLRKI